MTLHEMKKDFAQQSKRSTKQNKKQPTEWEKTSASDISDKCKYPKFIKNLQNSTPKNQTKT